ERLAAASGGGVVSVAGIGRLIRVAARSEGGSGRRVGGRVGADVDALAGEHVGVAGAGGAAGVAVQGVGDRVRAVGGEAAGQAGQAGRVVGDHTERGLVGAGVDRVVGGVFDHRGDRGGRLVDDERLAAASGG